MEHKRNNLQLLLSKNKFFSLFLVMLFLSFLFAIYSYINSPSSKQIIFNPPVNDLTVVEETTIECISDNSTIEKTIALPTKLDPTKTYRIKFKLDEGFDLQHISINVHYISFQITCDDKLIYTNEKQSPLLRNRNNSFNIVPIPKQCLNKDIVLTFHSALDNNRKLKIPQILIGSKQSILHHYFKESGAKTIAGYALLVTAFFLLISAFLFAKMRQSTLNVFILAFFATVSGLYILVRSWTIYYYIQNNTIIYLIEYTCLITLPLPIYLLFINLFYENNYNNWRLYTFEIASTIVLANLIIQYALTFAGISDFVLMQKVTFSILIFSAFFIFFSVLTADKNKIKSKFYITLSMAPTFPLVVLAMFNYYKQYTVHYTLGIFIVVIFFLLVHYLLGIKKYINQYNEIIENEFYSKLAYTDILTQLKNRNSLMEEKQRIEKGTLKFETISLFMIDINNLKHINDHYGHSVGDEYIRSAANIVKFIEKTFTKTTAYRFAGDEFIIISYDKKQNEVKRIVNTISKKTAEYKENNKQLLELAIGCCTKNQSEDFSFRELFDTADNKMYIDKENKKHKKGGGN